MEEKSLGKNHGKEGRKWDKGCKKLILSLLWEFIFYCSFLLALRKFRVYRILGHAVHGCQPEGNKEGREGQILKPEGQIKNSSTEFHIIKGRSEHQDILGQLYGMCRKNKGLHFYLVTVENSIPAAHVLAQFMLKFSDSGRITPVTWLVL